MTSIVMIVRESPHWTKRAIEAVRRWTDEVFRFVFVIDGADDYTARLVLDMASKNVGVEAKASVIQHASAIGDAASWTEAFSAIKDAHAVILSPRTIVTKNWLGGMRDAAIRGFDIVSPVTNVSTIYGGVVVNMPRGESIASMPVLLAETGIDHVPGYFSPQPACSLWSKAARDASGGFQEDGMTGAMVRAMSSGVKTALATRAYAWYAIWNAAVMRHAHADELSVVRAKRGRELRSAIDAGRRANVTALSERVLSASSSIRNRSRVAVVLNARSGIDFTGGTKDALNIADELVLRGHDVHVTAFGAADDMQFEKSGIRTFRHHDYHDFNSIAAAAKRWNGGVAIAATVGAIPAAESFGWRTVLFNQDDEVRFHEDKRRPGVLDERVERSIKVVSERYAQKRDTICISGFAADAYRKRSGMEPLATIQAGVHLNQFRPLDRSVKPRVIAFGRQEPRRQPWVLADVFTRLREHFGEDGVELVTIGRVSEIQDPKVVILENLTPVEVAAQLAASWVLIEPSLYQGFGLPALEAMACGVGVVSFANGGIDDYGVDGKNCRIVADAKGMADAVAALIEDRKALDAMGAAGREAAMRFDWSDIGARWEAALRLADPRTNGEHPNTAAAREFAESHGIDGSKPVILFVCHSSGIGGVEIMFANLGAQFEKDGYRVAYLFWRDEPTVPQIAALPNYKLSGKDTPSRADEIAAFYDVLNPVGVATFFFPDAHLAARISKTRPIIAEWFDGRELSEKALAQIAASPVRAPDVIASETEMGATFIRSKTNVPVVVVGAPTVFHGASKTRQELGLPVGKKLVVRVARCVADKGPALFCAAMRSLGSEYHGVWVGPIDESKAVRNAIASKPENVSFVGPIHDHRVVESYIEAADIVVSTTTTNLEGASNALIQAILLGKPVVSTDSGNTRSIIDDGVGVLVPIKASGADFASAVRSITPERAAKMSEVGRSRAGMFDIARIAKEWERVFLHEEAEESCRDAEEICRDSGAEYGRVIVDGPDRCFSHHRDITIGFARYPTLIGGAEIGSLELAAWLSSVGYRTWMHYFRFGEHADEFEKRAKQFGVNIIKDGDAMLGRYYASSDAMILYTHAWAPPDVRKMMASVPVNIGMCGGFMDHYLEHGKVPVLSLLCVSEELKEWAKEKDPYWTDENVFVSDFPIDENFWRRTRPFPKERVIGNVGRWVDFKRLDRLIRIGAATKSKVILCGHGDAAARWKSAGPAKWIPANGDPRSVYEQLGLFVLTSETEGYPRVLPEAMLMGLPIVATDVGGVATSGIDREFLFDKEDHDGMTRTVERLMGDAGLREEIGRQNRETCIKRSNRVGAHITGFLDAICRKHRAAS